MNKEQTKTSSFRRRKKDDAGRRRGCFRGRGVGHRGGSARLWIPGARPRPVEDEALRRPRGRRRAQLDAVVLGDALNPETLDELMNVKGASPEVVLSCLGTHNTRARPCVCDGTQSLIKAIQTTAQRDPAKAKARLVILSSIGVGDSHAQGVSMAWVFIRCIAPLFLRALFADLGRAEEACWREMQTANGVRCVAVRPPAFNDKLARGRAVVKLVPSSELKPAKKAALAREDVAVAMARLIDPAVFAAWAGKGVTVVVP